MADTIIEDLEEAVSYGIGELDSIYCGGLDPVGLGRLFDWSHSLDMDYFVWGNLKFSIGRDMAFGRERALTKSHEDAKEFMLKEKEAVYESVESILRNVHPVAYGIYESVDRILKAANGLGSLVVPVALVPWEDKCEYSATGCECPFHLGIKEHESALAAASAGFNIWVWSMAEDVRSYDISSMSHKRISGHVTAVQSIMYQLRECYFGYKLEQDLDGAKRSFGLSRSLDHRVKEIGAGAKTVKCTMADAMSLRHENHSF